MIEQYKQFQEYSIVRHIQIWNNKEIEIRGITTGKQRTYLRTSVVQQYSISGPIVLALPCKKLKNALWSKIEICPIEVRDTLFLKVKFIKLPRMSLCNWANKILHCCLIREG